MGGNFTFDVQVLSSKGQWTSLSRHGNATDARREARTLASGKTHQGVKVLQEHFDFANDRFVEKTIFKQMKHEDRGAKYDATAAAMAVKKAGGGNFDEFDAFDDFDEYEDYDDYDDRSRWLIIAGTALAVLAVVFGVAMFGWSDGGGRRSSGGNADYFVYDLPVVMTNIYAGGKTYQVRMNIQLELDDHGDARNVEPALSAIMQSVIERIQLTDAKDLQKREKIQALRETLRHEIQKAMGGTNLNGILFQNIQVN